MANEAGLRRWHRRIGVTLALFVTMQALSGLFLDVTGLVTPHTFIQRLGPIGEEWKTSINATWEKVLEAVHYLHFGGLTLGILYRAALTLGIVALVASGLAIYLRQRARLRGDRG